MGYREEGLRLGLAELGVLWSDRRERERKISQRRGYGKQRKRIFQGEWSTVFDTTEKSSEARVGWA